jgi:CPA2 family monovalent cation:H+ antiporter-2
MEPLSELGVIFLSAVLAIVVSNRLKQPAIVGYLLAGIVIGPYALGGALGIPAEADSPIRGILSTLGIIFLMFFLGIEFSITRLKKVKFISVVVSIVDVGSMLALGQAIGYLLGLSFVDRMFLSGIICMSGASVVAKLLIDMKKLADPEAEILLGVSIVEDFISVVYLAILAGLTFVGESSVMIAQTLGKMAVFSIIFIIIAIKVIPTAMKHIRESVSDETLVLFALTLVLAASIFAESLGVSAATGAFFIGIVLSGSTIGERVSRKITPFRDAFVALFFVAFGMMIDPKLFPRFATIIIGAVVTTAILEMLSVALGTFLCGIDGRKSVFIGAGMTGRGDYNIVYAKLGTTPKIAGGQPTVTWEGFYPFTGFFCVIITMITPMLMKSAQKIYKFFHIVLPNFVQYSGSLLSHMAQPSIQGDAQSKFGKFIIIDLSVLGASFILSLLVSTPGLLIVCLIAGLLLIFNFGWLVSRHFIATEEKIFALDLRVNHENFNGAAKFSAGLLASILAFIDSLLCLHFLDPIIILAITVAFMCSISAACYLGFRKFGRRKAFASGTRAALQHPVSQEQSPATALH